MSALVTGDLGHSIRCDRDAACGVKQRGWLGGFDAGASYGSAIAVEAGVEYVLRLVLKSAASAMPSQGGAVVASLASETGTLLWSHEYPLPLASAGLGHRELRPERHGDDDQRDTERRGDC